VVGIKRMDHICMAVARLEDRLPMLTKLFGMQEAGLFEGPQAGYKGVALKIPGGAGGGTQWELLEPLGYDGLLSR
jgi:hypothetical protein